MFQRVHLCVWLLRASTNIALENRCVGFQVVHFVEDDAELWHDALCNILFVKSISWETQHRAWKALENLPADAVRKLFEHSSLPLDNLLSSAPHCWQIRLARATMKSEKHGLSCVIKEADAVAYWQVLAEVTELQAINLTHMTRSEMPASDPISRLLISLPALTSLDLFGLHTRGTLAADLARNFAALHQLQNLSLANAVVPEEDVDELGAGIATLSSLTELDICEAAMLGTKKAATTFLRHLPTLQSLQVLHADRGVDSADKPLGHIVVAALAALPGLVSVDIGNHGLGEKGVLDLSVALSGRTALTFLNLIGNGVRGSVVGVLGECLAALPRLVDLDLDDNELGGSQLEPLMQRLAALTTLKHFSLRSCHLTASDAPSLAGALSGLHLSALWLNGNAFGDDGVRQLGQAIGGSACFQELAAVDCELSGEGAARLCHDLVNLTGLTALFLGRNAISPDSAKAFATAVGKLVSLEHLDVCSNPLSAAGVSELCSQLAALPALTVLRLESAALGAADGHVVAAALQPLSRLSWLSIASNALGPVGVSVLASALAHLTALTELELNDMDAQSEGVTALATHLSGQRGLRRLVVSGNGVDSDSPAGLALKRSLCRCRKLVIVF